MIKNKKLRKINSQSYSQKLPTYLPAKFHYDLTNLSEEQYWSQVNQQTHYLVADILNKSLPLPNLRKKENLDLNRDTDYRTICADYELVDSPLSEWTNSEALAEQIAYEYLLLVIKSLLGQLSNFNCHQAEYFEKLF